MSDEDVNKVALMEQSVNRVSSDIASLSATFQRRQIFAAQLSSKCDQLQRITGESETELATADKQMKRHREEVAETRHRTAALQAHIDAVKKQLDEEKQQHGTLEQQLKNIENAAGTANEKNQALSQLSKVFVLFFKDFFFENLRIRLRIGNPSVWLQNQSKMKLNCKVSFKCFIVQQILVAD